jgi:ATP-dependent DNA helicase RecQ
VIATRYSDRESALVLLRQMLGPNAEFREGQWEAIDLIANQRRRVLVVQRTGWGKSVVYFLAARILRDAGAGPAMLISPLLSLMRNQILAAEKLGIRAATMHSENVHEWEDVQKRLGANEADVLLISPERLANQKFLQELLPLIQGKIGMFVVDEAHCISDWGHDFRPDYRRIVRILRLLPAGAPVLCTTATANDRVVKDIETQIPKLHILRGPLVRRSLKLFNIKLDDQAERMAWLAHFLPKLQGNGIIYTLTIQDARRVAAFLKEQGIVARAYHADLDGGERIGAERLLLENDVKALVATVALGMGFDKPDLGFVIHFQRPGSVVAYYQQVGRAGRAVESAFGVLLSGREDDEIQDYFIRTAFPAVQILEEILRELGKRNGITVEELSGELNYPYTTLEKALKLLEVDGAVEREGSKYLRTANRWRPDVVRAERVTQHRLDELAEIKSYVEHNGCLMEFLSRALDDPTAAPCGKCMNCTGKTQRNSPPQELVQAAVNFLRSDTLILEPRLKWPKPTIEEIAKAWPAAVERFDNGNPKSMISKPLHAEEGRALCVYGDAGWGESVAHGKYEVGGFSEALINASAELIQKKWKPTPAPEWVTAIPSQRHSELVREFAERLAESLGLPFLPALRKRGQTPAQKEMQNSAMQVRNLVRAFDVVAVQSAPKGSKLPTGPVLLVDDVVDSRWTLTWATVLLRQHGSGPVYPFTLAKASLRGG